MVKCSKAQQNDLCVLLLNSNSKASSMLLDSCVFHGMYNLQNEYIYIVRWFCMTKACLLTRHEGQKMPTRHSHHDCL